MRIARLLSLAAMIAASACGRPAASPPPARHEGIEFLEAAIRAWPTRGAATRLVVTSPADGRVAIYDNALVVLVFDRLGRHEDAGRILEALATLQRPDGALPFSFRLDRAQQAAPYVRSGALAWVGYAATQYLDVAPGGPAREAVARMAHLIAAYLLAHQVAARGDPRNGLVTGGEGSFVYEVGPRGVEERYASSEIDWVSVEHNMDAFFFLRALGRVTGQAAYSIASERIAAALVARAWDGNAGQLRRGLRPGGDDPTLALDCASWGSLFLVAVGEQTRAETAFATGDGRFASREPRTGARGHKPYSMGPVFEDESVAAFYAKAGAVTDWARLDAVWPEGSAGVALAALRLGRRDRAAAILAELEPLRDPSGALPSLTADVPFEFDTKPSVASTAWVELVRSELVRIGAPPFLWAP